MTAAHSLGHVVEIGAVALRQHDLGEAGAMRGEHLLLHAADRQHASLQRDLAGHADLGAHRSIGEQADECGRHRDAGRRTVLRHRARGHVHVEAPLERARRDAELGRVGPHERQRDLHRLLHDVAELTGEGQSGLAVRGRGLDEQDVAAGAGHGEAGRDTRRCRALGGLREELRTTEGRFDARLVDVHRHERGVGCDLGRDLPQHLRELALEVPHSGLTRVVHDDVADRGVVDLDVLGAQAVALELRRAAGDRGR